MKIIKTIHDANTGIDMNYWVLTDIKINIITQTIAFVLHGYKDKETYDKIGSSSVLGSRTIMYDAVKRFDTVPVVVEGKKDPEMKEVWVNEKTYVDVDKEKLGLAPLITSLIWKDPEFKDMVLDLDSE